VCHTQEKSQNKLKDSSAFVALVALVKQFSTQNDNQFMIAKVANSLAALSIDNNCVEHVIRLVDLLSHNNIANPTFYNTCFEPYFIHIVETNPMNPNDYRPALNKKVQSYESTFQKVSPQLFKTAFGSWLAANKTKYSLQLVKNMSDYFNFSFDFATEYVEANCVNMEPAEIAHMFDFFAEHLNKYKANEKALSVADTLKPLISVINKKRLDTSSIASLAGLF